MGTINYKTSEVVTLSINPYDTDEYTKNKDFIEYVKEAYGSVNDETLENLANEEIEEQYNCDHDNASFIIDKYEFDFYNVSIENGYYEGLQILIDRNYDRLDDYSEKMEVQKELTKLKSCLIELAGVGFVATSPFWCTSYSDYANTIKTINQAVKEERNRLKKIPTINQTNIIYLIEYDLLFTIDKNSNGMYQLFLDGVKVGKPQEKRIECYSIAVNYPYR